MVMDPCMLCGSSKRCGDGKCPVFLSIRRPLRRISEGFLSEKGAVMNYMTERNRPTFDRFATLLEFRRELQYFLRQRLDQRIEIRIYGSICTGFGSLNSDLDLCVELKTDQISPADSDNEFEDRQLLQRIADLLEKQPEFHGVAAILGARVPIVKFSCRKYAVNVDVAPFSMWSRLGARSTKLLYLYSILDRRLPQLVMMLKCWAKMCCIGDASRASLSSYAWTIMMIHYLQQCEPPVLPVLQEMMDETANPFDPKYMIECYCTYFYESEEKLRTWTSDNHRSPIELWIGFLEFYGSKYAFDRTAVQISQYRLLQRQQFRSNLWYKPIAVMDPFEIRRNLAAALPIPVADYILRCLQRSLYVFGRPFYRDRYAHNVLHCDDRIVLNTQEEICEFANYLLTFWRSHADPVFQAFINGEYRNCRHLLERI